MSSSSNNNIEIQRKWMYNRKDPITRNVTEEYEVGLSQFMDFASYQVYEGNRIWCPCRKCKNGQLIATTEVFSHLYNRGFQPNYFIWTAHGEQLEEQYIYPPSNPTHDQDNTFQAVGTEWNFNMDAGEVPSTDEMWMPQPSEFTTENAEQFDEPPVEDNNTWEAPNAEAADFFNRLNAASEPLYHNCVDGLSKFSLAADIMHIKTNHNQTEACVNDVTHLLHKVLPKGNVAPKTYYETEKLMRTLSMPYHRIDVCLNNCMIYWGEDEEYMVCKFCEHPRYKPEKTSRKSSTRKRIPYKRMFYLPLADRLKRLFLSEKTAPHMSWHAEHTCHDGKMEHPSDGKAWKHFQELYPEFASESRNVYLGLCTDGFNPFGSSGGSYSLWPIILTPYNLPPDMCMKREFLYLSILVPGRNHPKRSLDIFLRPLIEELQELWIHGVETYDVSVKQNFNLKAVLMWTISDFPAYGMLSGWTTHGRLSCPYCMDQTDAFQLKNGRKSSWFDCHRRFLPPYHIFRNNKRSFLKGNIVNEDPPNFLSGEEILENWLHEIFGLRKTVENGGNNHINNDIEGYGETHNWHKYSIFWELPYWRTHLIRHILDVMHIEKNFFDNIINTLLNVTGKTKDSINSRKDLELYCDRKSLHLTSYGKAPVPIFRLSATAKLAFLKWLKTIVKFPDGYVSNIGRCVHMDQGGKIYGLKSHDCHVIMQRLFPFAFAELLPHEVHEAISDVGIFFRDLCSRSLKISDVVRLENNIAQTLCNLEKIFPPSFFDVMEHLTIHLPREAELCGPVQFRWMYPFERFMFHLKKKANNKASVEGSIVEQFINEEITNFSSHHFHPEENVVSSSSQKRHASGFAKEYIYAYDDVPTLFRHVGSGSGKPYFVWLTDEDKHIAHTYILLNCEELQQFERVYDNEARESYNGLTEEMLMTMKERDYSSWLYNLVENDYTNTCYPLWLQELVRGPIRQCKCWNAYFSRGYNFHTVTHAENKITTNYGVCVRGSSEYEQSYYGKLEQIIHIAYHGAVGLNVTLFRCKWFDTTMGAGTRIRKGGVVEVRASGVYEKYDPFVLTTQADQVCFFPYPRIKRRVDEWLVVVKVYPRGILDEINSQREAMQDENNDSPNHESINILNVSSHALPGGQVEDIPEDPISVDSEDHDSDVDMTDSETSDDKSATDDE